MFWVQKGTLLHVAAERGFCGVAAFLIHHYPNLIEMKDRQNRTPLHICAQHGMVCCLFGVFIAKILRLVIFERIVVVEHRNIFCRF